MSHQNWLLLSWRNKFLFQGVETFTTFLFHPNIHLLLFPSLDTVRLTMKFVSCYHCGGRQPNIVCFYLSCNGYQLRCHCLYCCLYRARGHVISWCCFFCVFVSFLSSCVVDLLSLSLFIQCVFDWEWNMFALPLILYIFLTTFL